MRFWTANGIFILFAFFNLDDPDWFLWVPTYLSVPVAVVAYQKQIINKRTIQTYSFFLLIVFFFSLFGPSNFLDNNSDTMLGMKETSRESIGALVAFFWVYFSSRR